VRRPEAKSKPIYHMQTRRMDDILSGLDIEVLVKLEMPAAPILWEHEGMFGLIPMEHVQEVLDAVYRQEEEKKTGWILTCIPWSAATHVDYEIGKLLSRRATQ